MRSLLRRRSHSVSVILGLSVGLTVSISTFSGLTSIIYGDQPGVSGRSELFELSLRRGESANALSLEEFGALRTGTPATGPLAAEGRISLAALARHDAKGIVGAFVSGNYFALLGTRAHTGRLLTPQDETAGAPLVAVVSDYFWRTQLDANPDALGAPIVISGQSVTAVGVAEPRFHGLDPLAPGQNEGEGLSVWIPLQHAIGWPGAVSPTDPWVDTIGRLNAGFTTDDVRSQFTAPAARLAAISPKDALAGDVAPPGIVVHGHGFGPSETPSGILLVLAMMLSLPLTVLLIGCANVANLQLARASERARELAVRAALGASRRQLVRLLTLEALVLAGIAVAVSAAATTAIAQIVQPYFPFNLALDRAAAGFAFTLMMAVTLLTGLAPAWLVLRRKGSTELKQVGAGAGARHSRLRGSLVVVQVALSLIMLCGSGVFLRAVENLQLEVPGALRTQIVAEFDPRQLGGASESRRFADDLRARLESDPRVTAVSLSRDGEVGYRTTGPAESPSHYARYLQVTPPWFTVMDVPVLAGRMLAAGDGRDVIVVSARLAESIAGNGSALGRVLSLTDETGPARSVQVVGVVADNRTRPMAIGDRPDPVIYAPLESGSSAPFAIRVRSTAVDALLLDVRAIVRDLEPRLPWLSLRRGEDRYLEDASALQVMALSIGGLGILALGLAAAGLYAVMAYVVQLRRREIGVRIAIGADPRQITVMVVRQGLILVTVGSIVGLVLALPMTFLLRSVFVGTLTAGDPIVLGVPALALLAVAVLASAVPARTAARTNPITVLRDE